MSFVVGRSDPALIRHRSSAFAAAIRVSVELVTHATAEGHYLLTASELDSIESACADLDAVAERLRIDGSSAPLGLVV